MELSDLSPELQEKAKECTTIEEFQELCAAADIKLSEEDLASIAGGYSPICPFLAPCPEETLHICIERARCPFN